MDYSPLVTYVELVSKLSSMSIWVYIASDISRLDNERWIGPGWKHSRQKSPHGAVVGQHERVGSTGLPLRELKLCLFSCPLLVRAFASAVISSRTETSKVVMF